MSEKRIQEVRLGALAVSRGIAMGRAEVIHDTKHHYNRTKISPEGITREMRRFVSALESSKRQLERLSRPSTQSQSDHRNTIFEAHLMMLSDPLFSDKVADEIAHGHLSSEWAVKKVADGLSDALRRSDDPHLREKALDFDDIAERLLSALSRSTPRRIRRGAIVVAAEVSPSVVAELGKMRLGGIVAERGGWTSHGFILAREIGVPSVAGCKGATRKIRSGDYLIIDGHLGEVIVNPSRKLRAQYRALALRGLASESHRKRSNTPVSTLDGHQILIRANVDRPSAFKGAKRLGAKGIGLYRSEFLFDDKDGFPSERTQYDVYRKIAVLAGRDGALIRTFDLALGALSQSGSEIERNPALGLRATRLMFEHPNELRIQLRALLRASKGTRLKVVLPMVSDLDELRRVKRILTEERSALARKGNRVSFPEIGVMVEVPSAVLMAEELLRESDFVSLGTNDLVQYILAADRDNEHVADFYSSLHPAVLRAIRSVIAAAQDAGKPVIVCGEMASSPVYVAMLIGLGARELSMNASAIGRVRDFVCKIAEEECRELASRVLRSATAAEAEGEVGDYFRSKWPNLLTGTKFHPGKGH